MAKKTYDFLLKLLLVGDSDVGKPLLLSKLTDDQYPSPFTLTIGIDFKIKRIEVRGKKIKLHLWDTAGQERFSKITPAYYRGSSGVVLVYDIANERSFENLGKWLPNVHENAFKDVQVIVLGLKQEGTDKRVVDTERGMTFSREHGIQYMEASLEDIFSIEQVFHQMSELILDKRAEKGTQEESGNVLVGQKEDQGRSLESKCF